MLRPVCVWVWVCVSVSVCVGVCLCVCVATSIGFECFIGCVRPLNKQDSAGWKTNQGGQVTRRECGLFDENNRLVRTIFWLCSASVSNKSTDKLTDTTKLDGEHKKL
jgi:hypothetical protein